MHSLTHVDLLSEFVWTRLRYRLDAVVQSACMHDWLRHCLRLRFSSIDFSHDKFQQESMRKLVLARIITATAQHRNKTRIYTLVRITRKNYLAIFRVTKCRAHARVKTLSLVARTCAMHSHPLHWKPSKSTKQSTHLVAADKASLELSHQLLLSKKRKRESVRALLINTQPYMQKQ